MSVYLINYDLNSPNQKHKKILEIIDSFVYYAKLSESSYAIDSRLTPQQIYDKFEPLIDSNDTLWVITLKKPFTGFGCKDALNWLDGSLTY